MIQLKRKYVVIAVAVLAALMIVYFISTIFSAVTIHAYVSSDIQKITAGVNGYVEKVYVSNNQHVKKGQLLMSINPIRYQHRVTALSAQLIAAKASYPVKVGEMKSAQYDYQAAVQSLALSKLNMQRYNALIASRSVSLYQSQEYQLAYKKMAAKVKVDHLIYLGKKQTVKVQKQLIYQLMSLLSTAKYNLSLTHIVAPASGYISNLHYYKGDYVHEGQNIFGLVADQSWHVVADYYPSEVEHMRVGQTVYLQLDSDAWHWYRGRIVSIAHGVAREKTSDLNMPYTAPRMGWVTNDYYVPVKIKFNEVIPSHQLFSGTSAKTIVIY